MLCGKERFKNDSLTPSWERRNRLVVGRDADTTLSSNGIIYVEILHSIHVTDPKWNEVMHDLANWLNVIDDASSRPRLCC